MKNDPHFLSFVAAIAALREAYRVQNQYTYCSAFGAIAGEEGQRFIKVYSTETDKEGKTRQSIYCFIALEDFSSKALGTVKKGDVMKPASWKAPAKHARGNVFNPDNGLTTCNSYGPGYLR
jgi:hypothetical protein